MTLKNFLELNIKSSSYILKQSSIAFDSAHQNWYISLHDREKHDKLLVTSSSFVIGNSLTFRKLCGIVSPNFNQLYSPYYWDYKYLKNTTGQEKRNHRKSMRQIFDKLFVWREKVLDIDITYPKKSTWEYIFGIQNVSVLQREIGNLETVSDEKWRLSKYCAIIVIKYPT